MKVGLPRIKCNLKLEFKNILPLISYVISTIDQQEKNIFLNPHILPQALKLKQSGSAIVKQGK